MTHSHSLLLDEADMLSMHIENPELKKNPIVLTSDEATCYFDSLTEAETEDFSEYDTINENEENPDWNLLRDISTELSMNDEFGAGAPISII